MQAPRKSASSLHKSIHASDGILFSVLRTTTSPPVALRASMSPFAKAKSNRVARFGNLVWVVTTSFAPVSKSTSPTVMACDVAWDALEDSSELSFGCHEGGVGMVGLRMGM